MQIIMAMVEVLEHLSMTKLQTEAVASIAEAVTAMKQLADSVLDIAKIEAHKMELHLTAFNLHSWLTTMLVGLRIAATSKKLEFSLIEAAGLPTNIVADPVRLRQIITNLVSNAVKVNPVLLGSRGSPRTLS